MLKAASNQPEDFPSVVDQLLTLFSAHNEKYDIMLEFYQLVRSQSISSVVPLVKPFFQSNSEVWSIKLSEGKTSVLLEALKFSPGEKEVQIRGFSHGESEVVTFLQCLPYISQLSFEPQISEGFEETRFLVDLFCAAADREHQTGEKILEQLASVYKYQTSPLKQKWFDFLLDLFTFELKTGLDVVPSPHTKSSILLNVLKLQSEKEQRSRSNIMSCCSSTFSQTSTNIPDQTRLLVDLFCAAAEREHQTGEKILEQLASSDFLLDLYSQMKDCETKTGLSLLPSLQSVFQSASAVWTINLSERKTSILLEMLKLQPEKKPVKLMVCSREESEVRSFLQCLPYIS
ncbi:hypothetical protein XENOCAPTIV_018250 [Xenoophorus captivus]|uniref:Uncharacterized protein n=1 Tax=Xenoophorus captivus TaxID=1517983 RepID=A0ABV0RTQ7_9TELE